MKKALLILFFLVAAVFFVRFILGGSEDTWICVNGEWVKHGNPSAPKPEVGCGDEGKKVSCTSPSGHEMSFADARQIVQSQCKEGKLKDTYLCNDSTGTWWFDFTPNDPQEGCNPACVVNVETGGVEINWRCTGLVEPTE